MARSNRSYRVYPARYKAVNPSVDVSEYPENIILREDGTPLLREDGSYFYMEKTT